MMKDGTDDVLTARERQAPPHQREADAESERRIRLADDRIFSPLAKAFGASATDVEQSRDLIIGTAIEMEEYPDMPRQLRLPGQPFRYLHDVGNLFALSFRLSHRPFLR